MRTASAAPFSRAGRAQHASPTQADAPSALMRSALARPLHLCWWKAFERGSSTFTLSEDEVLVQRGEFVRALDVVLNELPQGARRVEHRLCWGPRLTSPHGAARASRSRRHAAAPQKVLRPRRPGLKAGTGGSAPRPPRLRGGRYSARMGYGDSARMDSARIDITHGRLSQARAAAGGIRREGRWPQRT